MPRVLLLHKPYGVICQFAPHETHPTLKQLLPDTPGYYPAGRLDTDSEGLLVLTRDGWLQALICDPSRGHKAEVWPKEYWVQVEGEITDQALQQLAQGVQLKDGWTLPALAQRMAPPLLPERNPPIRVRQHIPTSWLALTLSEGRNRQVRRMTAHVGFPTLRLIRARVGCLTLADLAPGQHRWASLDPCTWQELPPTTQEEHHA